VLNVSPERTNRHRDQMPARTVEQANTLQRWGRHPRARARRVRHTRMHLRGAMNYPTAYATPALLAPTEAPAPNATLGRTRRLRETAFVSAVKVVSTRWLPPPFPRARASHALPASMHQRAATTPKRTARCVQQANTLVQKALPAWVHAKNVWQASMSQRRGVTPRPTVSHAPRARIRQPWEPHQRARASRAQLGHMLPQPVTLPTVIVFCVVLARTPSWLVRATSAHASYAVPASMRYYREMTRSRTVFLVRLVNTLGRWELSRAPRVYRVLRASTPRVQGIPVKTTVSSVVRANTRFLSERSRAPRASHAVRASSHPQAGMMRSPTAMNVEQESTLTLSAALLSPIVYHVRWANTQQAQERAHQSLVFRAELASS